MSEALALAEHFPNWVICTRSAGMPDLPVAANSGRSDFLPELRKMLYAGRRRGRDSVSEYPASCIDIRADELLISACVSWQRASPATRPAGRTR